MPSNYPTMSSLACLAPRASQAVSLEQKLAPVLAEKKKLGAKGKKPTRNEPSQGSKPTTTKPNKPTRPTGKPKGNPKTKSKPKKK